ncbi:hypothetical protein [Caballeronia sp. LZ034LL]|uniref:hypothetical protein n=1 Tax=Caballeronia sp. LZ034LL TaxID=3038567 RepID=UPI00285C9A60|nr:hypothetical protein [Caballeronia sp. LZ034LL]MDR5838436.1 hypothetical protein [Caballeronia sp. LZ034LL]
MHHSIEPHELTHIDLSRFQVVQVSDGTFTVVLWEAAELTPAPTGPATLTIRLCDPLNPVRRKDVCEHLRTHLAAARVKQNRPRHAQRVLRDQSVVSRP